MSIPTTCNFFSFICIGSRSLRPVRSGGDAAYDSRTAYLTLQAAADGPTPIPIAPLFSVRATDNELAPLLRHDQVASAAYALLAGDRVVADITFVHAGDSGHCFCQYLDANLPSTVHGVIEFLAWGFLAREQWGDGLVGGASL
jgi:hypothetical protein